MKAMDVLSFAADYASWHYTRALSDIADIWLGFSWFLWHYFSVPLLGRTLFSPWRRLSEAHHKHEKIGEYAGNMVVNSLMRLVGIIARSAVIICGCIAEIACALCALIAFVLWVAAPLVLFVLIAAGLKNLFTFPA